MVEPTTVIHRALELPSSRFVVASAAIPAKAMASAATTAAMGNRMMSPMMKSISSRDARNTNRARKKRKRTIGVTSTSTTMAAARVVHDSLGRPRERSRSNSRPHGANPNFSEAPTIWPKISARTSIDHQPSR